MPRQRGATFGGKRHSGSHGARLGLVAALHCLVAEDRAQQVQQGAAGQEGSRQCPGPLAWSPGLVGLCPSCSQILCPPAHWILVWLSIGSESISQTRGLRADKAVESAAEREAQPPRKRLEGREGDRRQFNGGLVQSQQQEEGVEGSGGAAGKGRGRGLKTSINISKILDRRHSSCGVAQLQTHCWRQRACGGGQAGARPPH